jgi:hypothetical protein
LSQAQQTGGGAEKAVMALENQWLQSQTTNNPDLVAPLLADTFMNTGADGKVTNRVQYLADSKASAGHHGTPSTAAAKPMRATSRPSGSLPAD